MCCGKTVTSKDDLISHQVTFHPDKVFHCEQCHSVYYTKELLAEHQKCHLKESEHNSIDRRDIHANHNLLCCSSVCLEENQLLLSNNSRITVYGVGNMDKKEKLGTCIPDPLHNNHGDILPVLKNSEAEKVATEKNIVKQNKEQGDTEEIKMEDIGTKKDTQKRDMIKNYSKFCLKFSKEFVNTEQNYKSKILDTINKIVEKRGSYTGVGAITSVSMRKEVGEKLEESKTTKPKFQVEKKVKKYKTWKCHCNHVFTSRKKCRGHCRIHPQLKFSCSWCYKKFQSQRSLNCHVYIHHTDEKRFICEYCGRNFRFWHSLRDHLSSHDKAGRLFLGDRCGQAFGSIASYESHCSSHSEAAYLCDVCGKSMKYFTSLQLHRLSHINPANLPQHSYAVCAKTYRSRYVHPLLFY
jgi:KRAB domain-containing zinc finger protein